jgi:hypothetical protein
MPTIPARRHRKRKEEQAIDKTSPRVNHQAHDVRQALSVQVRRFSDDGRPSKEYVSMVGAENNLRRLVAKG